MIKVEICEISIKRFWSYIQKTPTCWIWIGPTRSTDYGAIAHNNRVESAHRFSFELHVQPIPNGMWVLHRCDTPRCVNPEHLFLGTAVDNERDMRQKGRKAKVTWLGGKNKELSADLVPLLGKVYDSEISRRSNLNNKTIARIRRRMGIPPMVYRKQSKDLCGSAGS